ncbi:MAG: TonB-dependent receptor [Flavobacteriia bacterium]|nr:TonB-dependent receptor [Flavobacteriia bacterium]
MIKANYLKISITVLLFIFSTNLFFSQVNKNNNNNSPKIGILSGAVFDSITGIPIDYCSVRLFSVRDSSVKAGIYTDEKGKILLDEIPLGKYFIKISFLGYKTKTISGINFTAEKPNRHLGNISLVEDKVKELNEVKVEARKELLLNSLDKKVYDVGSDISVKGGSANDVLNNVPSVEVDQDGKISLRGDGNVTILIDGRPSSLSGSNGKSFLDALPANSIERIEIVTNPSSKYDPDGTSGIINIVLKKNKMKGINGNVLLSAGTGKEFNGNGSLNYRNAKMNLYSTYAYKYYEGERNYESKIKRNIEDSIFSLIQDRKGTDLMINNTLKFGSDFYLNDRNTIGFGITGNQGKRERTGDLYNYLNDENDVQKANWKRNSSDPSDNLNLDFNINYKLDFKQDKGNIIIDVNQSFGNEDIFGDYLETYGYNADSLKQRLENKEKNNITTAQVDYTRILFENVKLESGLKMIIRNSEIDTYSETYDENASLFLEDTFANFTYQYNEEVFSGYLNFGQSFKKFKYQIGTRLESAMQNPNLVTKNININNQYYNFYPSVFLTYIVNKQSEITLSYSRRINRPSAENLNPFTSYADPINLRMGNPYLKPEYINSYNLGYSINGKAFSVTASIFYRQTNDVITRIKNFYDNGTTAVLFGNIDRSESFGPELVLMFRPFPWMKNMLTGNGNSIKFYDDTPGYDRNNSGFFYTFKYTNSIDLWKKTATFQINFQYNSPRISPQGTVLPRGAMDLSFDKTFKEGKYSIGCRLSDVFDTREFNIEVDQPNSYQKMRFKQNTRRFFINFSYKFGKYEIKKSKPSMESGGGGFDF